MTGDFVLGGADAIVCHVVLRPTSSAANDSDGSPANPQELAIIQELRARLLEHVATRARDIPIRILHGDPGQRICEYAEYAECDLIVLGHRTRSSLGTWVRGSVSKYVVGCSPRSVLCIGE